MTLACTPWVFRREGDAFVSHTGQAAGEIKAVFLDEAGSILLDTTLGIGLLDDRDLPAFLDQCRQDANATVDEQKWLKLMSSQAIADIHWGRLPVRTIRKDDVGGRFNFQTNPRP